MNVEKRWMSKITGKLWDTPGTKNEVPVAVIPWDEWEAAINKRGEEVLKLAMNTIFEDDDENDETSLMIMEDINRAYEERFHEQPEVIL